jgi:monofunctional biosynthetic peptidoglycan transglycosylase
LRLLLWLKRLVRGSILLGVLLLALLGAALAVQSAIQPVSTLMLTRRLFGEPVNRQWVSLGAVAPSVKASVILSEDGQFCRHHGVDWGEIREAVRHGRGNGPSRGASTITMQVVKNLFLWPGRSYIRKAIEIPLAMLLDALWSKAHILEVYLNIAEWGPGIFGIEAAARHDFQASAADLPAQDAALLATALPNPILRNPAHPSRLHRALAARILRLAHDAGEHLDCLK